MKKYIFGLLFFLFTGSLAFATHQRAAEIVYRHINGLTYEVKIITYTRNNAANDSRIDLIIDWGDGTSDALPRVVKDIIVGGEYDVVYNEYIGTHTYPGIGTYKLSMEDPNRNYGVVNIPNSVNVPIFVESMLLINPFVGGNNSVQLLNQPVDHGCVFKKYIHNPGVYDVDGDSISYKLVKCRGAFGKVIPGYEYPNLIDPSPENTFTVNPITGDVVWDVPNLVGEFNFAILIEEWRNGVLVGSVVRDMQVIIESCDIEPPVFDSIPDTCVTVGDLLTFEVRATTTDETTVTLTATGGPFIIGQEYAYIDPNPGEGFMEATTEFFWEPVCTHVRKEPYQLYFKAVSDGYPINLAEFLTVNVNVNAPAPENLFAEAQGNSVNLEWDPYICDNAIGFKIYRRTGPYGFEPGYCETGVPAFTGFEFIKQTSSVDINYFTDDNNGSGLAHGVTYCYMITAVFRDSAESFASNEACASLKRDLPVITNISNNSSNNLDGSVYVAWAKPIDLDTLEYPGPYRYEIMRAEGLYGTDYVLAGTNYGGLNDTLFVDNNVNLNSSGTAYLYKIDLYSESVGYIGSSSEASSLFLNLYETDRTMVISWDANIPWLNDTIVVYRENDINGNYDSVGYTTTSRFRDTGLINGVEYCYYIKSIGSYSTPGIIDPLINFSQITCGIPVDNIPPCPPLLDVYSDCDETSNFLIWTQPADTCKNDIKDYYIYYSATSEEELDLIDSISDYRDTTYLHTDIESIIGCYGVKAADSLGNISQMSNIFCVDTTCGGFRLPNAFTPNGDGYNDYYKAFPNTLASVQKIDLVILNRWGKKVYETQDKYFKWDGRDKFSNQDCAEGVYFVICDVYEFANSREVIQRNIKESLTLFR